MLNLISHAQTTPSQLRPPSSRAVESPVTVRPASTWSTGVRGEMIRPASTRSTGVRGEMIRPASTRSKGVRGEMIRNELWREQPVAGVVDSGTLERPFRSASGRTSGLRGQLLSQAHSDHTITASRGHTPSSKLHPLSCPDSRPGTAVLACGHRSLRVGSEVISLPAVSTQNDDSPPITSLIDDLSDSTHLTHPSPDLNDSLASISFFDHTHQGQLGRTSAGVCVSDPLSHSDYLYL